MLDDESPWLAHQRQRWMRPDAQRWLRQDYERFLPAGLAAFKANFDPAQPRDEQGRWMDTGGSIADRRVRLAGDIPTNDTPEVPQQRPTEAKIRNRIARALARRFGNAGMVLDAAQWLYENEDNIRSNFDPPKTLEELQADVKTPVPGYDIHHIVERNSVKAEGSEGRLVDAPDNLVRIPRWKHWEINSWYGSPNEDFEWQTPREFLKGSNWSERRRIGLGILRDRGVLK
jgi:hypothetical protein